MDEPCLLSGSTERLNCQVLKRSSKEAQKTDFK